MWPNPQVTADLVTFTGEILNGKLHFLWSVFHKSHILKEDYQKYSKVTNSKVVNTSLQTSNYSRDVFRPQSNIYDRAVSRK